MKNPQVLIRKYGDRRLYDTGASRYVKLNDIARMVRDGIDVRVVDDRTGKDITHLIFTQIIVENAREKEIALPLQLLTQLVRTSDKATHDFLTWYLDNTMDLYQKAQNTVQSRISEAKRVVAGPMDFVRDLLSQYTGPVTADGTKRTGERGERGSKPETRQREDAGRAKQRRKRKISAKKVG
jgi:polyhydroxyalkanoate synthesis repressor PhaR